MIGIGFGGFIVLLVAALIVAAVLHYVCRYRALVFGPNLQLCPIHPMKRTSIASITCRSLL